MANILANGQTWLNAKLTANAAETVRVIRGGTVLCEEWLATPGASLIETQIEGGATVIGARRDWLGDPSDWQISGETMKPERGDLIEWDYLGFTYVYEAMPAGGEDVWTPSGRFEDRIRVHTTLIEKRAIV